MVSLSKSQDQCLATRGEDFEGAPFRRENAMDWFMSFFQGKPWIFQSRSWGFPVDVPLKQSNETWESNLEHDGHSWGLKLVISPLYLPS